MIDLFHPSRMLLPALGCALLLLPATARAADPAPKTYEIEAFKNVAYYDDKDADPVRHKLDLFLPKGQKDYPVVLIVHGGAWMIGDKSLFGLYSAVGKCLAKNGVGAVLCNYRLSPGVKHPEHIHDVARAFAWTYKNISHYGGNPERMFVAGHSAGGHLVSLLATDDRYLKAEGVDASKIKGVIGVSGVYQIPEKDIDLFLEGLGDKVRTDASMLGALNRKVPSYLNPFPPVFGNDPAVRRDASPLTHVKAGLPAFLLLYAQSDFPTLPETAKKFGEALREKKNDATVKEIKDRSHNTIMLMATAADDPVAKAMLEFIVKQPR